MAERDAAALMAWAARAGVTTVPLHMRDFGAPCGWGAEATADVRPPAVLVRVPLALCLSAQAAEECAEGRAAAALGARGWDAIYAVLAAARAGVGEAAARWGEYARQLPEEVGVPTAWTRAAQRLFDATPIGEQLQQTATALAALAARLAPLPWASEAALRWAYAVFWSRAMAVPGHAALERGALVPVADLLNHSAAARTAYALSADGAAFELRSEDAYAAGAELVQNYGARADEKLLLSYGFALAPGANTLNAASVRLSLAPADPLAAAKAALMAAEGLGVEQYVMQHASLAALSPAFLRAAAAALLLEPELYMCRAGRLALSAPHLQLRAAAVLHTLLSARLARLAPDPLPAAELAALPPAAVALALRYRSDQREALTRGVTQAAAMLAALGASLLSSPSPPAAPSPPPPPAPFLTAAVRGDADGARLTADLAADGVWARVPRSALIVLDAAEWAWLLPAPPPSPCSPELLFALVALRLRALPAPPPQVHEAVWAALQGGLLEADGRVLSAPDDALAGLSLLETRDSFLDAAAQLARDLRAARAGSVPTARAARLMQLYEAGRGRAPGVGAYVLLAASAGPWPRMHPHAFTRVTYSAAAGELELRTLVPGRGGDALWRNDDGCASTAHALLLADACPLPPLALPLSLDVDAAQRRRLAKAGLGCDHYLSSPPLPAALLAALHLILHDTPPPPAPTRRTLRTLLRLLSSMEAAFAPSYEPHLAAFAAAERSIVRECLAAADEALRLTPRDEDCPSDEEGEEEEEEEGGGAVEGDEGDDPKRARSGDD